MYAKWGAWMRRGRCLMKCPARDVVAWTAMVAGHAKVGMVGAARRCLTRWGRGMWFRGRRWWPGTRVWGMWRPAKAPLFDEIPERNAVTWTAMIAGYGKVGDVGGAEKVFGEVPRPDESSLGGHDRLLFAERVVDGGDRDV
ncbi:hypothetical protein Syun_009263 [Stephania yunnanensis]|uniref:Pentatricopeptide repeat-containing protein n=1 Tax=Stephania yunnanensis TaxID=152371 RepID=A0AAP0PQH3_9MAGN